jgi:hypothetical protein
MDGLLTAIDAEHQGYIKGKSARTMSTGIEVVLVSNPKVAVDNNIYVWVAMQFDTHVRYMADITDLYLM